MMREHMNGDFGEEDAMMSALQKSLIAETLQGARASVGNKASLHSPSRPFTPGDMPRHLFHGNDYSNRPGSSYKMNNVLGAAADEFANFSAVKTQADTSSQKSGPTEDVLSIMERHMPQSRSGLPSMNKGPQLRNVIPGHVLPSLDPMALKKQKSGKRKEEDKPLIPKGPPPSMKDFEDLLGDQNASKNI